MAKCRKCGKENGWYSLTELCSSCKKNGRHNVYLVCGILAVIGMIIGLVGGIMNYNYELEKCDNLDSKESNYDFDHKLEIDAEYNEHCYWLNNHPLALTSELLSWALIGIIFPIFIGVLFGMKYWF